MVGRENENVLIVKFCKCWNLEVQLSVIDLVFVIAVVVVAAWGPVRDDSHSRINTYNKMQYNACLLD